MSGIPADGPDLIDLARRVAKIMGHSGAAEAVRRYDELVAAGHEMKLLSFKGMWLVRETPLAASFSQEPR